MAITYSHTPQFIIGTRIILSAPRIVGPAVEISVTPIIRRE